jgi:hypothetical protein
MKKLKLIRKVVNILKLIPSKGDFQPTKYALELCLNHSMTEDACQIYQIIINSLSGNAKSIML